ncbi:MAG: WbqC family protein [Bacteroidota bacterium]
MTIAVMQPYIFPYLGYYQLVAAVDKFVFFDDVNFITKGWINRNRILQQNEPFKFTIPLIKASQNKLINELEIADYKKWKEEFIRQIEYNYKKAPHFSFVSEWLKEFLYNKEYNLIGELTADSISKLSGLFDLSTDFVFSSALNYRDVNANGGQDKIVRICELLNADRYINPQNGMDMYDETAFQQKKIDLKFIFMDDIKYDQFNKDNFSASLSILDVMMFNDIDKIKELLKQYKLINKQVVI